MLAPGIHTGRRRGGLLSRAPLLREQWRDGPHDNTLQSHAVCTSDWDSRILAKMFRKAVPGEGGFDLDPEEGWDCQGHR